ncbi:hypothetical protein ACFL0N_02240 [Pseudomonadota bacterium]
MTLKDLQKLKVPTAAAFAILFIGIIYGSIPGFSLPTLGQALWASGFSQSFANESIWTIHANNFALPEPAAIAFGLSGAWLTSVFIRIGIHPADAYSLNYLFWLSISFYSAYRLALKFKTSKIIAYFSALLWLSMPIIWGHSGFSMLALGFSLLPMYFLLSYQLFLHRPHLSAGTLGLGIIYAVAVLVAVFMDGYSFVMFAVASSGVGAFLLFQKSSSWRSILYYSFPVHFLSFLIALVCYTSYVGVFDYEPHSMEYFRGAGLDLAFMAVPTTGQHWMLDALGLSVSRKATDYFGHFSSWTTTFCLPILLFGVFAWFATRKKIAFSNGLFILLAFSIYMSLGPSLKINSLKQPEDIARTSLPYMPAERAVMPTGNEFIYKMPGFKQMRFPFRWLALSIFCAWLLSVVYLSVAENRKKRVGLFVIGLLVLMNLPNLVDRNRKFTTNRDMFFTIDSELVEKITKVVDPGSTVLFLPFRNDWMINYVAAKAKIRTFNVGGDKNLRVARKNWPETMKGFKYDEVDYPQLVDPLLNNDVDYVFITYFNSLTSSFYWPCKGPFKCPEEYRSEFSPIIQKVQDHTEFSTFETDLFTAISNLTN